ncbi:hypothetical protein AAFF_G00373820 [Aldrovandia affinis]|uniref:Uncharacterized protein n=1 Tax=Aldrovandia affinis TaxID=143900 RepID=A0AAD7R4I0_9TELE|nr:hypothetical protein AAFF_G00373820 [Aldrovandia affinis]
MIKLDSWGPPAWSSGFNVRRWPWRPGFDSPAAPESALAGSATGGGNWLSTPGRGGVKPTRRSLRTGVALGCRSYGRRLGECRLGGDDTSPSLPPVTGLRQQTMKEGLT